MVAPGVGVKIVHEIAAADDQDTFPPERRGFHVYFEMD
jgi:hypothetical protein